MKNNKIINYISIVLLFLLIYSLVEFFLPIEGMAIKNPFVILFMVLILILLFTINSVNMMISFLKYQKLSETEKLKLESNNNIPWWEFILSGRNDISIENEKDIMLDHDYDGIKELNNKLPGWWVNLFYITIIFGFIYMLRYYVIKSSPLQEEELKIELAAAEKSNNLNLAKITTENVTLLEDDNSLEEGKKIFNIVCSACHLSDGGGLIGPNLTDEYWISGGGIKNVFNTISNGGRTGKGMQAWKSSYTSEQIQKVASYVIHLQGTTPNNPKAKEGDIIWKKEN